MAYGNNSGGGNQQRSFNGPRGGAQTQQGKTGGGKFGDRKNDSILVFKSTDKETGEPKLNKKGQEFFRVSLTDEHIELLKGAGPGCALYIVEQSGTSKKTGKDYSGLSISVLPAMKK